MPPLRFRSRHLHATFYEHTIAALTNLGWIAAPVNFGAAPVTVIDYQPDERNEQIKQNTVAVSLGDYASDIDEELGAAVGGVRSAPYQVYIDAYMAEQSLAQAIMDDVRDMYTDVTINLVDQITGLETAFPIEIENIEGPTRIPGTAADAFKRHWRAMRLDTRLFFQS
jgi:hypothetical protein